MYKSITPKIRHPRKPLAPAPTSSPPPETESVPAQAYSGNQGPRPLYRDPVDPGVGQARIRRARDVEPHWDIEDYTFRFNYFVVVLRLPRGFFVPSMLCTSTSVSRTRAMYRARQYGVRAAGEWHVARISESSFSAGGCSVLVTRYFSILLGNVTVSLPCTAFGVAFIGGLDGWHSCGLCHVR